MRVGRVTAELEAAATVHVRSTTGEEAEFEAVVDSGFNGFIGLPGEAISRLNLPFAGSTRVVLGDGSEARLSVYVGVAVLGGRTVDVEVIDSEGGALIGMALLRGCELRIQVAPGGQVFLKPLSRTAAR